VNLRFMVWLPNVTKFEKYVSMGVDNAVYNDGFVPSNLTVNQLNIAAQQARMKIWRYPRGETADLNIEGYTLLDEPVMHGWTPSKWLEQRASFDTKNKKHVLGNLEGDKFSMTVDQESQRQKDVQNLTGYLQAPDICTFDFYGWSRVKYKPDGKFLNWYGIQPMLNSFRTMLRHRQLDVQELGVCVEMGNQQIDKNSRAVTRQELRMILWSHLVLGATTFILFVSRPNNKVDPDTKNPIWETNGAWDDCMPPELQLEFMLNKPLMEQVAGFGKPSTIIDTPTMITAKWDNGRAVSVGLDSGTVIQSKSGNAEWSLVFQSNSRPFSTSIYQEQLDAAKEIEQMQQSGELAKLRKENDQLRNQLSRIQTILSEGN
jgi:hypothetical protein